ncbi:MAG: shikimate dehydrogenase [Bacteroidales bacterium]|nr:shikimate dehydrogenase [Bacteroidales bacterium]
MRVFGLIGNPLGHSFSPGFFNEKFTRENLTGHIYRLFPLPNVAMIFSLLNEHPEIEGLNVTIPYKKEIIGFLDEIDPIAEKIGAVNTIRISRINRKLKLKGYNTDAFGFAHACNGLRNKPGALVLGTGGSALAVTYVLKQQQLPYISVSRVPEKTNEISYAELSKALILKHKLIINTTPLGMFPEVNRYPEIPYEFLTTSHHLFDLIYNPATTKFLEMGMINGASTQNGEMMLELQAERSWEIWNS